MAGHAQQVTLCRRPGRSGRVGKRRQRAAGLKRSQGILFSPEGWCRDEGATADLTPQIALIDKSLVRAGNRLWGNSENGGQAADGWQSLTRSKRARLDTAAQLVDDLLAQRVTAPRSAVERQLEVERIHVSGGLYG